MNPIIEVEHFSKAYGDFKAVDDISFTVEEGSIFAFLGPNGAGKTTSLECIEGLRKYDSGSVTINGIMGIQLQSSSLPKYIKALEAIKLFAKWNKTSLDRATLDALGIYELAEKPYYQLSTGQKRRLHLALALARNPDILFLDEPTAGLDVEGQISLHEQIRQLKAIGKTIILASHDMAEVENLCDRIAILSGGKIAFIGTVEQLGETIGKHYNITIQTENRTENYESENIGNSLLSLLMQYKEKGETITDIKIYRGSLEQHFIKIAKGE